jgi:hypothetical protein
VELVADVDDRLSGELLPDGAQDGKPAYAGIKNADYCC